MIQTFYLGDGDGDGDGDGAVRAAMISLAECKTRGKSKYTPVLYKAERAVY